MRTSTKFTLAILVIVTIVHFSNKETSTTQASPTTSSSSTKLTDEELQDAKDFAQALIQRDNTCDEVTGFSNANFSGRIDVWCDNQYKYSITKPNGRWKVEVK